jgi:L-Ala-D/L-Glu epimerase / N-acetyl-D-glutamate racemase
MKIARIETQILEMPMVKPLVTATNNFVVARGLLVKAITADGVQGYGYADLFPRTGETTESARHAVEAVLAPKAVGRDLEELPRIRAEIDHVMIGNARAKAALDSALYDSFARTLHVPLYVLLGGRCRTEINLIKMVSVDNPEKMAEEARGLVRDGWALKLKMSGKLEPDLQRVAKVREAVGGHVFMKVDANEAYDAKTAIRLARGLADYGVEIFEQPVPRDQLDALWEVKQKSPVKIEADQSVRTLADAHMLIKNRMVDAMNTGVQKAGSIFEVLKIAHLCEVAGIRCALSNTAGSMVGDAVALHVAVSATGIAALCELGEFQAVSGDPFAGLTVKNGRLGVPERDGLGVVPQQN